MPIEITDNVTGDVAEMDVDEVSTALSVWFSDAPSEVHEAVAQLQTALRRGEDLGELPAYLAVTVIRL